jgi:hypothetical protein
VHEKCAALDHEGALAGPAETSGHPAGSSPDVDEPPLTSGGGEAAQRRRHEGGLAAEPPVLGVGLHETLGVDVVEHLAGLGR